MAREDVGGLPVIKIEVIMEAEPAHIKTEEE